MQQANQQQAARQTTLEERDVQSAQAWGTENGLLEKFCTVTPLSETDHPYYGIWKRVWKDNDLASVFRISSDGKYRVLDAGWTGISHLRGILIRPEYDTLWKDAMTTFLHGPQKFRTPPDEDIMDIVDVDEPPMKHNPHPTGLSVIGHPGIGKRLWLYYALVRCLQEHLTVVFSIRPREVYIFNSNGVFSLDPSRLSAMYIHTRLPKSTWCLVDSSDFHKTVPQFIQQMPFFIVQTAPPRLEYLEWKRKMPFAIHYHFLKPPTLQELISGYELQKGARSNREAFIEEFYRLYGPSARDAYIAATTKKVHHIARDIQVAIARLDVEAFRNMFNSTSQLRVDGYIPHMVLLVQPGDFRRSWRVGFVTQHIFDLVENRFIKTWFSAMEAFYKFSLALPETRASAGYVLEAAMHKTIPAGGEWRLHVLSPGPPSRVRSDGPPPGRVDWIQTGQFMQLVISRQRILDIIPTHQSGHSPPDQPLEVVRYKPGELSTLEDHYYCPEFKNEKTFDSFIYSTRTNTITVFQATVSESHPVNVGVFRWLANLRAVGRLGAPKIRYIIATPNAEVSVPMSVEASEYVTAGVYHLHFEKLPRPVDE